MFSSNQQIEEDDDDEDKDGINTFSDEINYDSFDENNTDSFDDIDIESNEEINTDSNNDINIDSNEDISIDSNEEINTDSFDDIDIDSNNDINIDSNQEINTYSSDEINYDSFDDIDNDYNYDISIEKENNFDKSQVSTDDDDNDDDDDDDQEIVTDSSAESKFNIKLKQDIDVKENNIKIVDDNRNNKMKEISLDKTDKDENNDNMEHKDKHDYTDDDDNNGNHKDKQDVDDDNDDVNHNHKDKQDVDHEHDNDDDHNMNHEAIKEVDSILSTTSNLNPTDNANNTANTAVSTDEFIEPEEVPDVIYTSSQAEQIANDSVDIYDTLKLETLTEVRNRVLGFRFHMSKMKSKRDRYEAKISQLLLKDFRSLKVDDKIHSLILKRDHYNSEIKLAENRINNFDELMTKAKEMNSRTVTVDNTDEFSSYHSLHAVKSHIHKKERKIMKYTKELERYNKTDNQTEKWAYKEYKLKDLQYEVSKLKILSAFFSKEGNDISESVPLSNKKITSLKQKIGLSRSKLVFLATKNSSLYDGDIIASKVREHEEKIAISELEISVIYRHQQSSNTKDLKVEIDAAIYNFRLAGLRQDSEALITNMCSSGSSSRVSESSSDALIKKLTVYDEKIRCLQKKLVLLEIKNKYKAESATTDNEHDDDDSSTVAHSRQKYYAYMVEELENFSVKNLLMSCSEGEHSMRNDLDSTEDSCIEKHARLQNVIERILTTNREHFTDVEMKQISLIHGITLFESRIHTLITINSRCNGNEVNITIKVIDHYQGLISKLINKIDKIPIEKINSKKNKEIKTKIEETIVNNTLDDNSTTSSNSKRLLDIWSNYPKAEKLNKKIVKYELKINKYIEKLKHLNDTAENRTKIEKMNRKLTANKFKLSDLKKIAFLQKTITKEVYDEIITRKHNISAYREQLAQLELKLTELKDTKEPLQSTIDQIEDIQRKLEDCDGLAPLQTYLPSVALTIPLEGSRGKSLLSSLLSSLFSDDDDLATSSVSGG